MRTIKAINTDDVDNCNESCIPIQEVKIKGDKIFLNETFAGTIVEHDINTKTILFTAHSPNQFLHGKLFKMIYQ